MEFSDNKRYEISNQAVRKADEQREAINRLIATEATISVFDGNSGVLSLELAKEAGAHIKQARKVMKSADLSKLSSFDRAVAMDVNSNLKKNEAYLSYVYDPKTSFRIGSLLSSMFGVGTFQKLQEMVKPNNWPHKQILEQGKTLHNILRYAHTIEDILENSHDPLFNSLRKEFLEKLNDSRAETQRFYSENGVVSDLGKIKFHYSPNGYDFSYWENLRLNHVHINSRRVVGYMPKDSSMPEIISTMINPLAVHEVGHALHEALSSRTMPKGLAGDSEGYIPFLHGLVGEGCAMNAENIWFQQAKDSGKISELDIKLNEGLLQLYTHRKLLGVVYNILKKREDEMDSNPKSPVHFNKRAQFKMAELTGVRSHMFTSTFFDSDIYSTLYSITYIKGQEQIIYLNKRAKTEGYTSKQLMLGLMKGSWTSLPAQEKFLFDVYLPDLQKKGICR